LVREEAGSVRARDEAQSVLAVAQANLRNAEAQRAMLGSSPSALGRQGNLWVRVAVFAGDLGRIDRSAAAQVCALGPRGPAVYGRPVTAPPSANAAAGTADLYYAIPNRGGAFRVGQRVAVDLPAIGEASGISVPASSILRDIYGGEWVYVRSAPRTYERRRIEISTSTGGQALLGRGLKRGDQVVTAGAAELFGTEFGAK
jgi:multidrug efflux pump subunit AcrA (membrane-fusion protein)